MAKLLFKKGSFRILSDDVGRLSAKEVNNLTKVAGTVSHQARKRSKKSPEEFTKMLQKMEHWAALEHNWFTFLIDPLDQISYRIAAYTLWRADNLFCITERKYTEKEYGLLVSGNARMFNEAYTYTIDNLDNEEIGPIGDLLTKLNKENPTLFPIPEIGFRRGNYVVVESPELLGKQEILAHRAMAVEFNNCSRGFTHEDVRSRNGADKIASYLQESTRYVDYAKGESDLEKFEMKFVPNYTGPTDFDKPLEVQLKDGKVYHWTPQEMTDVEEGIYRALRQNGWKPEEARQWLPIGIKAQIVQTYNLNEWRHWFFIRTGKGAHSEIRYVAVNLLREVQKRIPDVFDDFEFRFKKDGTKYGRYIGSDKLI